MLDEPGARTGSAGERTFYVPEELGLEERLGESRAIHGHERARCARAPRVDRAGGELLSRAGLPCDENSSRCCRGALNQILDTLHRLAGADKRIE